MEFIILLIMLLILFGLTYVSRRSFIAPLSVFLLSLIMATSLAIANIENWQITMSDRLVPYVLSAVFAFALGCYVIDSFKHTPAFAPKIVNISQEYRKRLCGNYPLVLFCFAAIICTAIYINYQLTVGDFSNGIQSFLRSIYSTVTSRRTYNPFVTQAREITVALAEISIFEMLVIRFIDNKKSISIFHIIPIACFFLITVFSTDRNIFLRFSLYSLTLWIMFFLSSRNHGIERTNWMILKKSIVFVITISCLFYGLGKVKNYTSNFERMVGIYGGSGFYNFNLMLDGSDGEELQYGSNTFSSVRNLLNFVLAKDEGGGNRVGHGRFVTFKSPNGYVYSSNVHSAFGVYFRDFGYLGLLLYPFLLGLLFEYLYVKTQRNICDFHWILYALLIYPLVYVSITEQFFRRFHLGMLYELFWAYIIYWIAFSKSGLWDKKMALIKHVKFNFSFKKN